MIYICHDSESKCSNERMPHMALTSLPPHSLLPIEKKSLKKGLNEMAVNTAPNYESSFTEVVVACLKMLILGFKGLLLSWRLEKRPGE